MADEIPRAYLMTVPGGRPDLDEAITYAASVTPEGSALRIRMQPTVWTPGTGEYRAWSGVIWGLEVRDPETATRFREDLDEFVRGWAARVNAEGGKR